MAKKFTDLTNKATAGATDILAIVDPGDNTSKRTTVAGLATAVASSFPAGSIPPAALDDIWWEELTRTSLASAASTLTATFAARKYIKVLIDARHATGVSLDTWFRVNADTNANYAARWSGNQADPISSTAQTGITAAASNAQGPKWIEILFVNNASTEKVFSVRVSEPGTAGAGNVPTRADVIAKWANTASQVTSLTLFNNAGGNLGANSQIVVLGHD